MEMKLPYSEEAERGVISGIIAKPEKFEEVAEVLAPDDFNGITTRQIYEAMSAVYHSGKVIDLVTLSDYLITGNNNFNSAELVYLAGASTSGAQVDGYVRMVKEKSILRQYIRVSVDSIEKSKSGDETLKTLNDGLKKLQDIVDASVSVKEKDGGIVHVAERQREALDILQHGDEVVGLSTGIDPLDDIMGGMDKEELIIIAGQTGHGKSLLMQRIALNVAMEKKPVLYLSLEMSVSQQIARMYKMAQLQVDDTVETISKLPIYFYGGKDTMTLPLLNRLLRIAKEKYDIKEVFIDHIHYFSQDIENVTSELGLIVRTLKEYSRRYEIPIVAISTLRKLKSNGMPEIDDLKDSVMIGYDADIIMMIYRDVEGENRAPNELIVKVRKNRPRGKIGSVAMEITENYDLVPLVKRDDGVDKNPTNIYN